MKLKQFTKVVAVGSFSSAFCFLASCKDAAEETSDSTDKPAKETPAATAPDTPAKPAPAPAVASEKLPVYIVTVSGKGWGVGNKTSSVLTAQSGVTKVKLSGLRATVFVDEGTELNKDEIEKQLKAKSLGLVSIESGELSAPVASYTVNVKGTGSWTDTDEKVRVALEKIDTVSSAYVNNKIELYLSEDVALDEEAVKTALTSSGVKFVDMKKEASTSL